MISAETKQQRRAFARRADVAVLPEMPVVGTIVPTEGRLLHRGLIPWFGLHGALESRTKGSAISDKRSRRPSGFWRVTGEREGARWRKRLAAGKVDEAQILRRTA